MKTYLIMTMLIPLFFISCSDTPDTEEVEVEVSVSNMENKHEAIEEEPPVEIPRPKETSPPVVENSISNLDSCNEDLEVLKNLFKGTSFSLRGTSGNPECEWDTNFDSENLWFFKQNGIIKHRGKFNESFMGCLELKNLLPISNFSFQVQELPRGNTCRVLLNINFQEILDEEGEEIAWNTQIFELQNISNNGFDAMLLKEKKRNDEDYDQEEPEEVVLNFEARD